ncbi:hypothetical protein [Legionella tucsonensis]|uniref:Substrate of the Dot/Icm secretion system n=1 Tax=Legionella tucsonensis TaxID=40335 RepID=A0A0W0ZP40_9GAMM|nr:hypothetical protein [Legionella tucsonensis]KTD70919.1 substrate of the Dot/Icm secretion system [Legionella tucsonensis]
MSANAPVIVSTKNVTLPPREDILKTMQTGETTPEGAQYIRERVHQIVENSKWINRNPEAIATGKEVLKVVDEYAKFVEYKFSQDSQIWKGQDPKPALVLMQSRIAEEAIDALSKKNFPSIRFDFAISEEGHFVRGYASTEKEAPPLEVGTIDALDRLFNAWLANEHRVVTKEGNFYKNNPGGNQIKLTAEEVEALMADSAKEFKEYLKKSGVESELVSRQREYPGEHRLEEIKKAAAQKAVDTLIKEAKLEEEKPEPEQPQNVGPAS